MASRYDNELSHLADAIEKSVHRELHVGFAAQVTRYDASKQVVDVQPLVAGMFPGEGSDIEQVYLPVIPSVPVVFPGAGGYRLTFPIQVGDVVEILIQDRSHDAWQDQGGKQAPIDRRTHHLADAVAIPGLHDNKHSWTGAATDGATFGKDGGPQVVITSTQVKLGGADASEGALLTTEFKTAFDVYVAALQAWVTATTTPNPSAPAIIAANATLATAKGVFDSAYSGAQSSTVKVKA